MPRLFIDLQQFCTGWQCLLSLSGETRPYIIREELLSRLPWIKEKVAEKEAKATLTTIVVEFGELDPLPGLSQFENKLTKFCITSSLTSPTFLHYLGPGVAVDCKDGWTMAKLLGLTNTAQTACRRNTSTGTVRL